MSEPYRADWQFPSMFWWGWCYLLAMGLAVFTGLAVLAAFALQSWLVGILSVWTATAAVALAMDAIHARRMR